MDKTDRLRDYGLAFLLYEHGLGVCGYELIRELFIFIKLILNSYLMMNNINRLIRLLQQILEFRKVESGNLKLRVSYNDLASFVTNHVESFRPLIQKKQMHLQVTCPSLLMGWFDPDKVDKILYNLLSNAAKYNKTVGNIAVILKHNPTNKYAITTVYED